LGINISKIRIKLEKYVGVFWKMCRNVTIEIQNLAPGVILLARHIAYESAAYSRDMTENIPEF